MTQTSTPATEEQKLKTRCDPAQVKVGSFYSRHSFGVVTRVQRDRFALKNEDGFEWEVGRDILAQEFSFSDQYAKTEEVSRTRALEILAENIRTAVTVNFHKKADAKEIAAELAAGQGDLNKKQWAAKVEAALLGEERTMVGYHYNTHNEHGRLEFIEHGKGPRTIDPRTVNYIIVNQIRYVVTK